MFPVVTSIAQQSSPALEQVLSQLKGVRTSMRGWRACCPAHADRKPSLSIGLGEHEQVLLKCFAGCSLERIVEAMGLTMTDLFPDVTPTPDGQAAPPGQTHHFTNPTLTLVDLALEKQLPWKFLFSLGVMGIPLWFADPLSFARWHACTSVPRQNDAGCQRGVALEQGRRQYHALWSGSAEGGQKSRLPGAGGRGIGLLDALVSRFPGFRTTRR